MTARIAIIGKPNVGKSTLFNKLCGRRLAITDDQPGVTRDAKTHKASLIDLEFDLIDTAGLEKAKDDLKSKMLDTSMEAAASADIVLFMFDARNGITPEDHDFSRLVHRMKKKVILVANKAEGKKSVDLKDVYKLGFSEPVYISAEHNLGFTDLYQTLKQELEGFSSDVTQELELNKPLRLAILGRPNVGKSTLFNQILGFERTIVSDIAGTTRDAISHSLDYKGRTIEIIDTAGMRKRKNIDDHVENLSVVESINALRRANVVAIVTDATCPLEKQDLAVIRLAVQEGKAIVLVINKCDLIKDLKEFQKELDLDIGEKMYEIKGVPTAYISAKSGKNINSIFKAVSYAERNWLKTVGTGQLNSWLKLTTEAHIPPLASNGRRIRLKYITQIASKPPTFNIFANVPEDLPESYARYLYNSLRESFGLYGVPIRLKFRKNDNPYN